MISEEAIRFSRVLAYARREVSLGFDVFVVGSGESDVYESASESSSSSIPSASEAFVGS